MSSRFSDEYLVNDVQYDSVMKSDVLPWLAERENVRRIPVSSGFSLYCVSYNADNPAGTVVLLHGFTENAFKYSELIYSLLHNHYCVVAYDQRGHGRSSRTDGLPSPSVTHVDRFSEYVDDFQTVYSEMVVGMPGPFLLFAHSMGGAVASLYLEAHPDSFSAVVLSSPMIAPAVMGLPKWIPQSVASCAVLLGKAKKNPFFMKPYSGPEDFDSSCATDIHRFSWYDRIKAERVEFQNSVPSYRWSLESLKVTGKILSPGMPERIACPVLLFSAENDSSVLPGPQKMFIGRVPNGRLITVSGAKHEIFRSVNDVLMPWWKQVLCFYAKYARSNHHDQKGVPDNEAEA